MTSSAPEPVLVVSCDSHVGPRLREDLRQYCPQRYLRDFDSFVAAHEARRAEMARAGVVDERARFATGHPNTSIAGHHDVYARLDDMDNDGVAAEVIYQFSQNGEPMPLVSDPGGGLGTVPSGAFELGAVGYQIYNRWLADFVSVEPERHIGLAYLPMWDVDAAVHELERAADSGLRGVNFPPPSRAGHLEYTTPAWEPFWSACERYGMSLNTHSSGAAAFDYSSGPGGEDLLIYESGGWMARRAVWWLIHGQVFERHPDLKLVITEQFEGWWTPTLHELDSVYVRFGRRGNVLPKMPSEYARRHVFMGASFLSPALAEQAFREGFVDNVLWAATIRTSRARSRSRPPVPYPSRICRCATRCRAFLGRRRWRWRERTPCARSVSTGPSWSMSPHASTHRRSASCSRRRRPFPRSRSAATRSAAKIG